MKVTFPRQSTFLKHIAKLRKIEEALFRTTKGKESRFKRVSGELSTKWYGNMKDQSDVYYQIESMKTAAKYVAKIKEVNMDTIQNVFGTLANIKKLEKELSPFLSKKTQRSLKLPESKSQYDIYARDMMKRMKKQIVDMGDSEYSAQKAVNYFHAMSEEDQKGFLKSRYNIITYNYYNKLGTDPTEGWRQDYERNQGDNVYISMMREYLTHKGDNHA